MVSVGLPSKLVLQGKSCKSSPVCNNKFVPTISENQSSEGYIHDDDKSFTMFRLNNMKLLILRLGCTSNRHRLLPWRRLSTTAASTPKICIIGSGPASFYAAQHLLKVGGLHAK
jgi:hypothetical protein